MSHPHVPLFFERLSPERQIERSREFLSRWRTRRTVRSFSGDPVPFELIENAILAASSSPSGANQQPWHFVVIKDADLKRRIRIAAELEEKQNYEGRFPDEWLQALAPFGTTWQKEFLEIAPYLIVVFRIDYGLDLINGVEHKRKHYYVQESVGIACGALLAALHLSGLATLIHTPSPMGFLTDLLERPRNERPFLLIPVGYPAFGAQVPAIQKKPLAEVLTVR
ncbi:MAG: nitroreductase family protein [Bryobacterales bacterium]|jgi:nitroreductase|nr:nitroreductase family protein [Bryobacterales bacterium]